MRSRHLVFVLVFILLTGGCVTRTDLNTMQPHTDVDAPAVYRNRAIGQTFVAQRDNLCGVELTWVNPEGMPGPLLVYLRPSPEGPNLLRVKIDPANQAEQDVLRIRFPAQRDSADTSYYLHIEAPEATAQQPLRLRAAARDVYAPGRAYVNGEPWPGDLAFRTVYAYDASYLRADTIKALRWAWLILPGLALFWAPGALLLRLWPATFRRFNSWERLALMVGLSLAFIAFSLLWITQLGGRLTPTTARLLYGFLSMAALGVTGSRIWRRRAQIWDQITDPRPQTAQFVLMGLVLTVGLGARLIAIRDLSFPAWVDSVHHATLTRIIVERGQVPSTYTPYVAVDHATYHFGFHAAVAHFVWLSGLPVERAMLLVGQLFNAIMALQIYLLTRWLTQRRWTAVFATLFIALLSTMPAYYVSWGRYTQLSGLLVLPVAALLTIEAVENKDWRGMALALVSQAGLILIHYRVLAFYVCLVGVWWLVRLMETPNAWRRRLQEVVRYAALGLGAGVILLPWIAETAVHLWLRAWLHWGGDGSATSALWDFSLNYAARGFDRYLLTVGIMGAVLGLWERQRFSSVLALWLGALFIVTNPSVVRLPGEGLTNNIAMLITWFIPQAIWSGFVLDELLHAWWRLLSKRGRILYGSVVILLLLGLSMVGIYRQLTILNPESVLALETDRAALEWIATHTSPEDRFLINSRLWQKPIYMGTDGGYWITPLTGRVTTTPPALYPLGGKEETLTVRELNEEIKALARSPDELARQLRHADVDYVYVGARGGPLAPRTLTDSSAFGLVYTDAYVRIYKIAVNP